MGSVSRRPRERRVDVRTENVCGERFRTSTPRDGALRVTNPALPGRSVVRRLCPDDERDERLFLVG